MFTLLMTVWVPGGSRPSGIPVSYRLGAMYFKCAFSATVACLRVDDKPQPAPHSWTYAVLLTNALARACIQRKFMVGIRPPNNSKISCELTKGTCSTF